MKFAPYNIDKNAFDELTNMCPLMTYKVCDKVQIPINLPRGLFDKVIEKVVVLGSGDSIYSVYMVNLLRNEKKDKAIDQNPLIIVNNKGNLTSGFIHHGNWEGKTIHPEDSFFEAIEKSGIEEYYPYVGIPNNDQGGFDDLKPDSHREAFWKSIRIINNNFER